METSPPPPSPPIRAAAERSWRAILLLLALFAAGLWFVVGNEDLASPVVRGAKAPPFSLPRLAAAPDPSGGGAVGSTDPIELAALSGRVVLVNFWATWCEPCEREMPAMERLYQRLHGERFELVAVSIDDEDAKVQAFVRRYSLTFPIAMDRDKAVSAAYQTTGVPESLLIDREGRIVERYVGPREWDSSEYVKRIEALFEAPPGEAAQPPVDPGTNPEPGKS